MKHLLIYTLLLISPQAIAEKKSFGSPDSSFEAQGWSIPVPGYGIFTVYKEEHGEPMSAPYQVRTIISCSDPKQFIANPVKPVGALLQVCSLDKYEVTGDTLTLHFKSLADESDTPKCVKRTEKISAKNVCRFYRMPDSVPAKKKAEDK